MAIGNAGMWPPQAALLSRLSKPEHRQRVFGLQFMLLNLGLGVGGLVGASILDVTHPSTFTAMYTINAVSYVFYFGAVATLRGVSGPEAVEPADGDGPGGYREVLADARLRRYVLGALVMLTCGYGSMDAGLPAFMTTVAHLPVNAIGVVFFLNTLIIVVAQVWVLKRIEGRSRTRLLAVAALIWGSFWLVVALSAGFPPTVRRRDDRARVRRVRARRDDLLAGRPVAHQLVRAAAPARPLQRVRRPHLGRLQRDRPRGRRGRHRRGLGRRLGARA